MTEPRARTARQTGMRTILLLTAPLLPLLVACSGSTTAEDPAPAASSAVTLDDLRGTWVMGDASSMGHASDPVPHARITLTFDSGRLGASAGCNSMSGTPKLADGHLEVDGLTSTEIGCPPKIADTEEWLSGFLQDDPSVSLGDDMLTLKTDGGLLQLVPGASPGGAPTADSSGGVVQSN